MEEAVAELGTEGDVRVRAELCANLVWATTVVGSPEAALTWAEQALPLAERHDFEEILVRGLSAKSQALFDLGRHREAAILARGALNLAEELGDNRARAEVLLRLSVQVNEDDPVEGLKASLAGAEAARRAGDRTLEIVNLANGAESAIDIGQWDVASEIISELEGRDLTGFHAAGVAFSAAMLAALRGDVEGAFHRLDEVASRMESDMVAERTWHLRVLSVVKLAGGDLEGAFRDAMAAVEPDPTGMNAPFAAWGAARAAIWLRDGDKLREALRAMIPLRGRWTDACRRSAEAGLAALEGRTSEAAVEYDRALEAWAAMDLPLDFAQTAVDAATVLPEAAQPSDAIERARQILTSLGARPLLDRLSSGQRVAG
jgi:tetratricopeptide (TPR) repeat protein